MSDGWMCTSDVERRKQSDRTSIVSTKVHEENLLNGKHLHA